MLYSGFKKCLSLCGSQTNSEMVLQKMRLNPFLNKRGGREQDLLPFKKNSLNSCYCLFFRPIYNWTLDLSSYISRYMAGNA